MYEFTVTPEFILMILAGLLAVAFDYFPGLAKWFDGLGEAAKKQLNAGIVILIAAVLFAGSCWGLFSTNLVCDTKGALDFLYIVFLALTVNQGLHLAFKPTKAFQAKMFGK